MLESQDKRSSIYLLILLLSAAFSYFLIIPRYFPCFGLAVFGLLLSSLFFSLKRQKNQFTWLLYLFCLSSCLFLILRANSFLTFLNFMAVFYFGSLLILADNLKSSFLSVLLSPVISLFWSFVVKNKYVFKLNHLSKAKTVKRHDLFSWFKSVGLTVLILVIIIPLLSYANPFFNQLTNNLLGFFNFKKLLSDLFGKNFYLYLIRFIAFLIFLLFIPRLSSLINEKLDLKEKLSLTPLPGLLLPKITLVLVLLVFFITQTQLYFSSEEVLLQLGYSHSQYAREVFTHLSIVSLIIFGLIYHDKVKKNWAKITTYLLIIEAFFLNLMALKSVYDYSHHWGYTHKRLYGYSLVIWLFGLFSLFLYKYLKNLKNSSLVKSIVVLSGLILLGINLVNFDYIIYHFAKSTTHEGIDHVYLSKLSTDAKSYQQHLNILFSNLNQNQEYDPKKVLSAEIMVRNINFLQKKYQHLDYFQTFNLSEYLQYQKVKDLDLKIYQEILNNKRAKANLESFKKNYYQDSGNNSPNNNQVRIKITNLDDYLYQANYEIQKLLSPEKQVLARSTLDSNEFSHQAGPGTFLIVIYKYTSDGNIRRELTYTIGKNETIKEIQLVK